MLKKILPLHFAILQPVVLSVDVNEDEAGFQWGAEMISEILYVTKENTPYQIFASVFCLIQSSLFCLADSNQKSIDAYIKFYPMAGTEPGLILDKGVANSKIREMLLEDKNYSFLLL